MAMKRLAMLVGGLVLVFGMSAWADDPPSCGLDNSFMVSQDNGTVTIACSGVTASYGERLANLLTQVLQRRLDLQAVAAKLDELEGVPETGKPRDLDEAQRQAIVQALVNQPSQTIAILAHAQVEDAPDYGKAIATALLMVGWQVDGHQIKRAAPAPLDDVRGVALLVRNKDQPPPKTALLRDALKAAHITAPILSDRTLAADATVLWIGRRPEFMEQAGKP
jgi:hypothetical protein